MSENITLEEVQVAEVAKKEFKIKKIVVRDILVITRYLKEVNLTDTILKFVDGASDVKEITWADIRREKNLTKAEFTEAKKIYGEDIQAAMVALGVEPVEPEGRNTIELVKVVLDILSDESSFGKTVTFLSYLYEVGEDEILDLELSDLQKLITGVMANKSFLAAL